MSNNSLDPVTRAYQEAIERVRGQVAAYAEQIWHGHSLAQGQAEEAILKEIVPLIVQGQLVVGDITSAYMDAVATRLGVKPPGVTLDGDRVNRGLRGVDPQEVYRRPAVTAYTGLKNGMTLQEAKKAGLVRLLGLIDNDLGLARRHVQKEALYRLKAEGIQFYRRVLSLKNNHCALCVVASTQRYRIQRELLPIHPGCGCTQEPLPKNQSWEHVIDPDRLEQAHAAVEQHGWTADRGGRDPDYRKLIIQSEHGELGPVIELKKPTKGQH